MNINDGNLYGCYNKNVIILKNNSHTPKWYSSLKWIDSCEYMCCESLKESCKKLMVLGVDKGFRSFYSNSHHFNTS